MTNSDAVPDQVATQDTQCKCLGGKYGHCDLCTHAHMAGACCRDLVRRPAEPQAGAQAKLAADEAYVSGPLEQRKQLQTALAAMTEDRNLWRDEHEGDCPVQAALDRISSYVLEAQKTPITRESILDEPKVDAPIPERYRVEYKDVIDGPVPSNTWDWEKERVKGLNLFAKKLMEELGLAEAQLAARKQISLAQYDEMQGLCRLVLSETGK